jgi:Ca-activated chloride channel family protein
VRPGENIQEEVSALYAKIQTPVLSNLVLDFGDVLIEEVYPQVIPDLFSGSQLLVAGRYRLQPGSTGRTTLKLSGIVEGKKLSYQKQVDLLGSAEDSGTHAFIPRLWAARKIGYLLNQIRYQGENQEWVDAVIELSLQYGIITPYTSFLVVEENLISREGWDEAAEELMQDYAGPSVGAEAVDKAEAESNLRAAESVPQPLMPVETYPASDGEPILKYVDEKTFYLRDGIWIDSLYDQAVMKPIKIGFGEEVYFDLLQNRPDWGKYLALGEAVIFVIEDQAYQIIPGEGGISSLPSELSDQDPLEGIKETTQYKPNRTICSMPMLFGLALLGAGKGLWIKKGVNLDK